MESPPALFIKARDKTAGAKIEGPKAAKEDAAIASIFGINLREGDLHKSFYVEMTS